MMNNFVGKSLGRYHIIQQLGEGGMAIVYKAFDTRLEREVAIKIIRTGLFGEDILQQILKRFEREAKALARMSHPNIVKVHDYGEHEEAPYLVMEYIPSGTLKDKLGQPIYWKDALQMLLPIVDALAYAHKENIVHRDLKPSNILLSLRGQPLLTDFGIAKILELEDGQTLTGTGVSVGTPEYMAPEQGMGDTVDARADIYALGVVLYEMVTGRKPYAADTPMAVILKHITDPLPPPKNINPDLPDGVEKLLLKMLAKQPDDRYQDMDNVETAIQNLLNSDAGITSSIQPSSTTSETNVIGNTKNEDVAVQDKQPTEPQVGTDVLVSDITETANEMAYNQDEKKSSETHAKQSAEPVNASKQTDGWVLSLLKKTVKPLIFLLVIVIALFALFSIAKSNNLILTNLPTNVQRNLLSESHMASDPEGNQEKTVFSKEQNIFLAAKLREKQPGTQIESRWYYQYDLFGNSYYVHILTLSFTATTDELGFYFQFNNPGIAGEYRVEIYIDQSLIDIKSFAIE